MKQMTPPRAVQIWPGGGEFEVVLAVDGARVWYVVQIAPKGGIERFVPEDTRFMAEFGPPQFRRLHAHHESVMLSKVAQVNRFLHWPATGRPGISRGRGRTMIRYILPAPKDSLDPMVTFLVTSKGTVFGGYFGG